MIARRHALSLMTAAALLGAAGASADEPYFYSDSGAAIRGYDTVAYFQTGAPVKGERAHAVMWKGATWYFASAENRSRFEMNPEAYAPQYGGYCAYAVSRGYTASVDPTAWKIVDGKLYLNYSATVQVLWSANIPGNIKRGDGNWPAVLSK